VISRVADHCFWLGRYLERTESLARTLFVTRNLALDAELTARQCWLPVLGVTGEEDRYIERFGIERTDDSEAVQYYLTWEPSNAVSISASVSGARENARSIREVVSLETWEAINGLHLWLGSAPSKEEFVGNRYNFFRHIREQSQLCLGVIRNTMLHDNAFDFISLGVMLERVGQTSRLLDVHHHAFSQREQKSVEENPVVDNPVVEAALWVSILRACSGLEPYMKRHHGIVSGRNVAKFLVDEPRFPRSVRFCLNLAYQRLASIRPPEERTLPGGLVLERLRVLKDWLVEQAPEALDGGDLHGLLTHVVDESMAVCDGVAKELLGYA
jgi:uncharacterized alpha-E superfamily protein